VRGASSHAPGYIVGLRSPLGGAYRYGLFRIRKNLRAASKTRQTKTLAKA
jgi:hypothetical protein